MVGAHVSHRRKIYRTILAPLWMLRLLDTSRSHGHLRLVDFDFGCVEIGDVVVLGMRMLPR